MVNLASERQAEDIVLLDVRRVATFADYFVIMGVGSLRQMEALREDLVTGLKASGVNLYHSEGTPKAGWVLLDYSEVIVHLFGAEEREYYGLEQLWSGASQVVRIL